jgi:hypothetical protein
MAKDRRRRTDRTKRRRREPLELQVHSTRIGPGVSTAPFEEVLTALREAPDPADWETVAGLIVPVFPRRRPMPFAAPEPVRVRLPPGVLVHFGIDLGPAFAYVLPDMLAGWPVTADGLALVALDNLRGCLASSGPGTLIRVEFDGIETRVLQTGLGVASTAVLLSDELRRIFGSAPQRFVAPSRDVLVSLPLDSDPESAVALVDGIADADPNVPAVESFVLEHGALRCEPLSLGAGVA